MLKNEVLDVQKLADTAENEPLQVPEIWKTLGLWVHYGCSAEEISFASRGAAGRVTPHPRDARNRRAHEAMTFASSAT